MHKLIKLYLPIFVSLIISSTTDSAKYSAISLVFFAIRPGPNTIASGIYADQFVALTKIFRDGNSINSPTKYV